MFGTKFLEFTKGQLLVKTQLKLELNGAKMEDNNVIHSFQDRPTLEETQNTTTGVNPVASLADTNLADTEGKTIPGNFKTQIPYKPTMRMPTDSLSRGTIYGMAQTVRTVMCQASIFGLNRNYITSEGVPSPTMIERRLKEVNVATEVKEAKLGRFFNATMANGFYDNPVSLLVTLMALFYKALFFEKTTYSLYSLEIPFTSVKDLVSADLQATYSAIHTYLVSVHYAFGCHKHGRSFKQLCDNIIRWVAETADNVNRMTATGRAFNERDLLFKEDVKVWDMYTYSEGGNTSGRNFGSHFGFVRNRYLRDEELIHTNSTDTPYLNATTYTVPTTDAAIDQLVDKPFHLNCSGLTLDELSLLNKALGGNKRSSPFLVDQTIDLEVVPGSVQAYHAQTNEYKRDVKYTSVAVSVLVNKIVMNHRFHEDLLCAQTYLVNWLAQGSTETVESHLWTALDRTMSLPRLGLKRAAFPFMLEGEAVCLSSDALNAYQRAETFSEGNIYISLVRNVAWYWGEFLFKVNKKNSLELLRSVDHPCQLRLDSFTREPTLTSAVLGEKVAVPLYSQTGTYLTEGIDTVKRREVKFGNININNIGEFGYALVDGKIIFNNIVAPGCAAILVGRGGTLLKDTPYYQKFNINAPVKVRDGYRFSMGYDYYDLWAMGVVNRWQGHDVHYTQTGGEGELRAFAATNTDLATPPARPKASNQTLTYTINSIRPRQNRYDDAFDNRVGLSYSFRWHRAESYPVEKDDQWANRCCEYLETTHVIRTFKTVVTDVQNFQVSVFGVFNIRDQGFQMDMAKSGVAIPANKPKLDLEEVLLGEPQIQQTGDPPLASSSQVQLP